MEQKTTALPVVHVSSTLPDDASPRRKERLIKDIRNAHAFAIFFALRELTRLQSKPRFSSTSYEACKLLVTAKTKPASSKASSLAPNSSPRGCWKATRSLEGGAAGGLTERRRRNAGA